MTIRAQNVKKSPSFQSFKNGSCAFLSLHEPITRSDQTMCFLYIEHYDWMFKIWNAKDMKQYLLLDKNAFCKPIVV